MEEQVFTLSHPAMAQKEEPAAGPAVPCGIARLSGTRAVARARASRRCRAAYHCLVATGAPLGPGPDGEASAGGDEAGPPAASAAALPDRRTVLEHAIPELGRFEVGEAREVRQFYLLGQDDRTAAALVPVFEAAADAVRGAGDDGAKLLLHVARGRRGGNEPANDFYAAAVYPAMLAGGLDPQLQVRRCDGDRAEDAPDFEHLPWPFVYVHVGIFERLSPGVVAGQVFAPRRSLVLSGSSAAPAVAEALDHHRAGKPDAALDLLPPCRLLCIPDAFPKVTPDAYDRAQLLLLFAGLD